MALTDATRTTSRSIHEVFTTGSKERNMAEQSGKDGNQCSNNENVAVVKTETEQKMEDSKKLGKKDPDLLNKFTVMASSKLADEVSIEPHFKEIDDDFELTPEEIEEGERYNKEEQSKRQLQEKHDAK